MAETTRVALAALLRRAGGAHGVYETNELGGIYDQQWPEWYARYLVEGGIGDLLGRAIDSEALSTLLARCDRAYRQENPAEEWPDDYARRLLGMAL